MRIAWLALVAGTALAAASAASAAAAASPGAVRADGALDRYLAGLASLQAEFSQTLTDARGRTVDTLDGTLVVLRPGRFRWEVHPRAATSPTATPPAAMSPAATQLMVADGRNVWFYDRELEQVTVKPAAGALTATPAMLLSGTVDIHAAFEVRDDGKSGGLDWVRVTPRRGDAEFRVARLGFAGLELRRMEIDDKLGQRAVLVFGTTRRNQPVAPDQLQFTPPAGVDVIGKPVR
jgi:outer membrane lipoprotein carrier protein